MNWLPVFGKFIQQTTKTWLGLFFASGFILLFPKFAIVGNLADKDNFYLGVSVKVVFVLSCGFIISDIIFYVRDIVRDWNTERFKIEALKRLTPPERELMRRYLKMETKSMGLDPRDPIVILFVTRKWFSQPFNYVGATLDIATPRFLPPYVLDDWIYDYLKDHPELIS